MSPKRLQEEGLKSHMLVLFEFPKHRAHNKRTEQEIENESKEYVSKKAPKRGPEITDPSAVSGLGASRTKQNHIRET